MSDLPDDLLTPKQVAQLLKLNQATVYRYIQSGLLPCWVRAGSRKYVSRSACLGLFAPPTNTPAHRLPSHAEAVEALRRLGARKGAS